MLCILSCVCEDSQSNNCVYEACRYLLSLTGKNATENEIQYLSNQKKCMEICILSFKTQLKD